MMSEIFRFKKKMLDASSPSQMNRETFGYIICVPNVIKIYELSEYLKLLDTYSLKFILIN